MFNSRDKGVGIMKKLVTQNIGRKISCGFFVVTFTCTTIPFLGGCGSGDGTIAKKDFREIREYEKQNDAWDTQKYIDMKRAENFETWKRAAEKGIPEGQMLLGICYLVGIGVHKDAAVGANWVRKAAEKGLVEAQMALSEFYLNGTGVPQSAVEAVKWIRKVAEKGNAETQYKLGKRYYDGDGIPEDKKEAVQWYRKAAEQGCIEAQYALKTLAEGLVIDGKQMRVSYTIAVDRDKLRNNIRVTQPDLEEHELEVQVNKMLNASGSRTVEIIRNRINKLGIHRFVISAEREHRVNIQLPELNNKLCDDVERNIQNVAFLEFKLVHAQNNALVDRLFTSGRVPEGYVSDGNAFRRSPDWEKIVKVPDYLRRLSLFEVPDPRYAFMLMRTVSANKDVSFRPVYVLRKAEMDGTALSSASTETDPVKGVCVSLKFNAKGASDFGRLTKRHVGRQLAIIIDDTIYSASTINLEIQDGSVQIDGNFSISEANELRDILNTGTLPLPVPMKIIERRAIGSTVN